MLLPNTVDYTTPGEVSRKLGIPRSRIYHAIYNGKLKVIRVGHSYLIRPEEVRAALEKSA